MRKILPILLALMGLGAGMGGGFFLRPGAEEVVLNPCGDGVVAADGPHEVAVEGSEDATRDYVKLNNQFVVPVVEDGRVTALVVLSLSLEVTVGSTEQVYLREPKLRDGFLQVLFDHANAGGFKGAFTDANTLSILRHALMEAGQKILGDAVTDVLIADIIRQDT